MVRIGLQQVFHIGPIPGGELPPYFLCVQPGLLTDERPRQPPQLPHLLERLAQAVKHHLSKLKSALHP